MHANSAGVVQPCQRFSLVRHFQPSAAVELDPMSPEGVKLELTAGEHKDEHHHDNKHR